MERASSNGFGGGVNHFDPRSPLYDARYAKLVVASDVGLAIVISGLVYLGQTFGWYNMLVWYFLPYLWVNHWLGKRAPLSSLLLLLVLTVGRTLAAPSP